MSPSEEREKNDRIHKRSPKVSFLFICKIQNCFFYSSKNIFLKQSSTHRHHTDFNFHFLFPSLNSLSFYVTAALHYIANCRAFNKHSKHLNTSTFIHLICTQFLFARRRDCIINKQNSHQARGLNSNERAKDGGKFILSLKTFCIL